MTRQERHDEVVRLSKSLGLSAESIDNNSWHIRGTDGYCGLLVYNQRLRLWKALGGCLDKAHFGELVTLLNLLACTSVDSANNS
jgi:hypothetical protein